MKISVIIVDDEPLARKGLLAYIQKVSYMEVKGEFNNAIEALSFLKNASVDVLFLDINMPKIDGLNFANALKNPPLIVFTTAYREYAVESYELGGFDYLVKPITFERFFTTCERVFDKLTTTASTIRFDQQSADHFYIKKEGTFLKIYFKEVMFITGMKDFVKIHLKDQFHIALISLKSVMSKLPDFQFLRVHKSYIVNKSQVSSVTGNMLVINDNNIPIGKTYREKVISQLLGDNLWRRDLNSQ